MVKTFGSSWGDFLPPTFLLPGESRRLKKAMMEPNSMWILKPPNMLAGDGVRLIKDFREVEATGDICCVQKYLTQPFLINNLKFDLRIYVLVTSVKPLRVYMYEDGLTR